MQKFKHKIFRSASGNRIKAITLIPTFIMRKMTENTILVRDWKLPKTVESSNNFEGRLIGDRVGTGNIGGRKMGLVLELDYLKYL